MPLILQPSRRRSDLILLFIEILVLLKGQKFSISRGYTSLKAKVKFDCQIQENTIET